MITNKHIAVCKINVNGDTLWWRISRCELRSSKDGSLNQHVISCRVQMQTLYSIVADFALLISFLDGLNRCESTREFTFTLRKKDGEIRGIHLILLNKTTFIAQSGYQI